MPTRKPRRGFSLIELLIVISIILIIITIAVPKFQRAQITARETAAIQEFRALHTAQVEYQSQYGRYAASLTELGPPASGAPSISAADLVGNDVSGGEKQGYKFTLTANQGGYVITATPLSCGSSGNRTFFSDQTMSVHFSTCPDAASLQSPEMK